MAGLDPKFRINLERVTALAVDGNAMGADILRQVLTGFGVRRLMRAAKGAEAQQLVQEQEVNLIVCSDVLPDMSGYDFVRWLRRSKIETNAFAPVIIVSGHTRRSEVQKARDCGANFVLAKPISTKVLLERVIWISREGRPFVEAGEYLGPDRRFQDVGPPANGGRRRGDPAPAAREAQPTLAEEAA
ncbi:MAG TPA: response regulator [Caulobacteraceae bacterium]